MCHYVVSNCNLCFLHATNRCHILYIVMEETTQFPSQKCHGPQLLVIKASFSCCEKRGWSSYWLDCSKWLQVWYLCRKGAQQPDPTQFCKGPECMCQNSSNWRRLNKSIMAIASMTSIYTAFLQLTKQFLHHNEWSLNRAKQDMQVHSSSSASELYPLHSSFGESNILPL
jgi:hypothetical protein